MDRSFMKAVQPKGFFIRNLLTNNPLSSPYLNAPAPPPPLKLRGGKGSYKGGNRGGLSSKKG